MAVVQRFLHRRIVPVATNVAGGLEGLVETASVRSGVRPSIILLFALAVFALLARRHVRRGYAVASSRAARAVATFPRA